MNGALSVDRLAERVDHAADHRLADRNGNDPARALDDAALVQPGIAAQNDDGNGILFQVERHAILAVFKLDQLIGHALVKTARPGDTVADEDDRTGFILLDLLRILLDLCFYDFRNLFGFQIHGFTGFLLSKSGVRFQDCASSARRRCSIFEATVLS